MARDPSVARVALVLAGGAARGAYEVGVVQHILEEVSKDLGRDVPLDILCGTSIGALNACALAAFADAPRGRATRLVDIWTRLRVQELVQPDLRGILSMGTRWLRGTLDAASVPAREGGVVNPEALERLIEAEIPFAAIDGNLQSGRLDALTVSTTHVASGRTVVYVNRTEGGLPPWSLDPTITPRAARITSRHAFASSQNLKPARRELHARSFLFASASSSLRMSRRNAASSGAIKNKKAPVAMTGAFKY